MQEETYVYMPVEIFFAVAYMYTCAVWPMFQCVMENFVIPYWLKSADMQDG